MSSTETEDFLDQPQEPNWYQEFPLPPFKTPPSLLDMINTLEPLYKADVKAAGIAVRAKDTGRVLMLQRANDKSDPASGTWEFPGGRLNDGEHPYNGAKREWQEEMGTRLPRGDHAGEWQSGVYNGFIHDVPSESSVKLNLDSDNRNVSNHDDPDGDNAEVAAWFHPHQLRRMSSLRSELRESRPWNRVAKGDVIDLILKKIHEDEEDEEMEKDSAPPPAGDIPADSGSMDFGGMSGPAALNAVGPTINSVHVDVPLKNISVSYATSKKKLRVKKGDKARQLIYGVVLEPNSLDSQDDYMMPDHVERAAHTYMKNVARGKASVTKLQHRRKGFHKERPSLVPVESYIAPCDFSYDGKENVKKGTWVMVMHAEDSNVWEDVMNGKYTGLSIGGSGIRQEFTVPPKEYMVDEPAEWFKKEWRDWLWEGSS